MSIPNISLLSERYSVIRRDRAVGINRRRGTNFIVRIKTVRYTKIFVPRCITGSVFEKKKKNYSSGATAPNTQQLGSKSTIKIL